MGIYCTLWKPLITYKINNFNVPVLAEFVIDWLDWFLLFVCWDGVTCLNVGCKSESGLSHCGHVIRLLSINVLKMNLSKVEVDLWII